MLHHARDTLKFKIHAQLPEKYSSLKKSRTHAFQAAEVRASMPTSQK
jgi:hypothetical protein